MTDLTEAQKISIAKRRINDFRTHLCLPKFIGVDANGERNDWIAVRDVQMRLSEILVELG